MEDICTSTWEFAHAMSDPVLERAEQDARNALSQYLEAEMRLQVESYEYLAELNEAAARNYEEMAIKGTQCVEAVKEMGKLHKELDPAIRNLSVLEENINVLEKAAAKLDLYSEELLCRFKALPPQ